MAYPERTDYSRGHLRRAELDPDPIRQFGRWFADAVAAGGGEPTAMTLATVDAEGWPDARIVLLKGYDEAGFTFFTNYRSPKGGELAANPHAALVFWWPALERQVRLRGTVSRVAREESVAYFATRPRGSQLGAWASRQSTAIPDAGHLEARLAAVEEEYAGRDVPCPEDWGGYRLAPSDVELWQGRPNRLHDRFRYRRPGPGEGADEVAWVIERLSP
jgi:pyridoxamine 5'-phosphate oxidase